MNPHSGRMASTGAAHIGTFLRLFAGGDVGRIGRRRWRGGGGTGAAARAAGAAAGFSTLGRARPPRRPRRIRGGRGVAGTLAASEAHGRTAFLRALQQMLGDLGHESSSVGSGAVRQVVPLGLGRSL